MLGRGRKFDGIINLAFNKPSRKFLESGRFLGGVEWPGGRYRIMVSAPLAKIYPAMSAQAQAAIALSIRQPWAALLICGLKSVEIRAWPTARKGRILIHAAKLIDPRPIGWNLVPPEFQKIADFRGGIIGACDIIGCTPYRTIEDFSADCHRHLNPPSWFRLPLVYGFILSEAEPLPFQSCPGSVRFFRVPTDTKWRDYDEWFPEFINSEPCEGPTECRA
jgi:hypothetical protein